MSVIEDENLAHDLRQKASNALTQAAMIYQQVSERHELERRTTQQAQATVERFQEVVQRHACQALRRREAPAHQLARGD